MRYRRTARHRDWAGILADLRQFPGRWVVRLPGESKRLTQNIKERASPELRELLGPHERIETKLTGGYTDELGHRRGTVWLRLVGEPPAAARSREES